MEDAALGAYPKGQHVGFRVWSSRVLGFQGFRVLGFWGLGFRVLPGRSTCSVIKTPVPD